MTDRDDEGQDKPQARKRSGSRSRSRAAKRPSQPAKRTAAVARARANAAGESITDEEAVHAPESDRTQPLGRYLNAFNEWVNANGKRIDEETGEELEGDDLDELMEANADESEAALRAAEDPEEI